MTMARSIVRFVCLFVCVSVAACGRVADAPAPRPNAPPDAPAPADEHANLSEVRVEEGMLRDLRVTTATVESRRGDEAVTLLGELSVDERTYAEVGAPVAARVTRLLVGPGDRVREGQALAELQATEVGRARATHLTAQAHVTLAESALDRKRALAAERIAPQREVQEAEAAATAARQDLRAATAALSAMGLTAPEHQPARPDGRASKGETQSLGSSLFILATPVPGIVIERKAMRGQMLDPGTPAFRIADLSTLWLTVHAFERDAVRVRQGTSARVFFAALPGQEFTGNVTMVGRQVSTESRTVDVRIDVRNREDLLRPGMSASAALPLGSGTVGSPTVPILAVPVSAVQRVGDSWCVFIPKAQGVFEIRKIGRGRDLGAEVELLSGVAAGETIVVDGAFLLKSQAERREAGHDPH